MKRPTCRLEPSDQNMAKSNDSSGSVAVFVERGPVKKPYRPPKLTEYGNVARLTAGVNGTHMDPGQGTGTKLGFG
jgi:hypothetical protein